MDGNNLRLLTSNTFYSTKLRSLTEISMTNCKLNVISEQSFSALSKLISINLSNNNITSFSPKVINDTIGTRYKLFTNCARIQVFHATERLETIILSGNQLTTLAPYQETHLTVPRKIMFNIYSDYLCHCKCHHFNEMQQDLFTVVFNMK